MEAPTGVVYAGVAHLLQSSIPPDLITFSIDPVSQDESGIFLFFNSEFQENLPLLLHL
jgi:hypothetical protein